MDICKYLYLPWWIWPSKSNFKSSEALLRLLAELFVVGMSPKVTELITKKTLTRFTCKLFLILIQIIPNDFLSNVNPTNEVTYSNLACTCATAFIQIGCFTAVWNAKIKTSCDRSKKTIYRIISPVVVAHICSMPQSIPAVLSVLWTFLNSSLWCA